MRPTLMALLAGVSSGGCLLGEVQDIPCTADDECATAHFCDLTVGSCRAELDGVSAPDLQVMGVAVVGEDEAVPAIARTGTTSMVVVLQNLGGLPATDVGVSFPGSDCVAFVVDESTLPSGVVPGGLASVDVTATPDGTCAASTTVDWALSFSGRTSRGTFTLTLE